MGDERLSYRGEMVGLFCRLRVSVATPPDLDEVTFGQISASAILDSGSEATLIRHEVAKEIGLIPGPRKLISHPTTADPVICLATTARLGFLNTRGGTTELLRQLYICDRPMDVDVLIGLDCFEGGEIRINVPRGTWSVEIPPRT